MLISELVVPFTYEGKPAQMYVLRNDGYCWGRIVTESGQELDVTTEADHYDQEDEIAADAFIEAALGGAAEPALTQRST